MFQDSQLPNGLPLARKKTRRLKTAHHARPKIFAPITNELFWQNLDAQAGRMDGLEKR
jgi:hypothetical protein